ncbi:hypothetical protein Nepgr_006523 [Nepenthes gracilis]|uniref:Uncharacterized protein n=1 Tax=Nepenthes gracilis TaxID=150966 RepID=A0AAD3S580_NEPGR|nr:hypothetical protein Nepgr_006523 [Nepenthes gracilis]
MYIIYIYGGDNTEAEHHPRHGQKTQQLHICYEVNFCPLRDPDARVLPTGLLRRASLLRLPFLRFLMCLSLYPIFLSALISFTIIFLYFLSMEIQSLCLQEKEPRFDGAWPLRLEFVNFRFQVFTTYFTLIFSFLFCFCF